jgi:hypothetical protein
LISLDKIQEVIIQEHKRRLNSLTFFHDRKWNISNYYYFFKFF